MRSLTTVLIAALSATSVASAANLLTNGEFDGLTPGGNPDGGRTPTGWGVFSAGSSQGSWAVNQTSGNIGYDGVAGAARMRPAANANISMYLYQTVTVTVGQSYALSAYIKSMDGDPGQWVGAFMFSTPAGNTSVQDAAAITSFLPGYVPGSWPGGSPPWSASSPVNQPKAVLDDPAHRIVQETVSKGTLGGNGLTAWTSISALATNAGTRTPGIGSASGSAAYQTQTATTTRMLVGFFNVTAQGASPNTTGFSDLLVDHVSLEAIPEPATLMLLGLGAAAMLRRRRVPDGA